MVQIPQGIRDQLETLDLPSIPEILLRFLHLAEDEYSSMAQLADLVGQDPSLSARVITVANSVAFRRSPPTSSLFQCMVTLGTRLSRTLAACLVIQKTFSPSSLSTSYDFSGFWKHSLLVADVCRAISEQQNYSDPDEAYLAGLLHDAGQLLLLSGIENRYANLLSISHDESSLRIMEEQKLGTDHAVVGAWMIDKWGLSSSFLADAVMFHHAVHEDIKRADTLSKLVWTAHVVCHHSSLYAFEQVVLPNDFDVAEELLQVDFMCAKSLYEAAHERVGIIAEALGVCLDGGVRTLPVHANAPNKTVLNPSSEKFELTPIEEAVRDMAMFKPLQQDLMSVKNEAELYVAAQESARILFGLGSVAFLTVQQDGGYLRGAGTGFQPELLQQLRIPLEKGCSLASCSFIESAFRSAFDDAQPYVPSLLDMQLCRIMEAEGLLCLPMRGRNSTLGVIICGVAFAQARRILRRTSWLMSFAHAVSVGIESWRGLQTQFSTREENIIRRFEVKARRVVHEAANPLGVIKNYLSIMNKKIPPEMQVCQELDVVKEEINRVSEILRGMGSLEESANDGATVMLNTVITAMLSIYRESLFEDHGISVELDLDPDLPVLSIDQAPIKQILFNIWNNASDALNQGGAVYISTRSGFICQGNAAVELAIRDTGPGLPSDVKQRLFTPLESDRRPGHSGMGLSIVADLVEQIGGWITCQSKSNQGTVFSILLPIENRQIS